MPTSKCFLCDRTLMCTPTFQEAAPACTTCRSLVYFQRTLQIIDSGDPIRVPIEISILQAAAEVKNLLGPPSAEVPSPTTPPEIREKISTEHQVKPIHLQQPSIISTWLAQIPSLSGGPSESHLALENPPQAGATATSQGQHDATTVGAPVAPAECSSYQPPSRTSSSLPGQKEEKWKPPWATKENPISRSRSPRRAVHSKQLQGRKLKVVPPPWALP